MIPKSEIYSVRFNKYKLVNGDIGYSVYTLDAPIMVGMAIITPVDIKVIKERIKVTFKDGASHEFGVLPDTEIFRRPLKKKEEPNKEEDARTT